MADTGSTPTGLQALLGDGRRLRGRAVPGPPSQGAAEMPATLPAPAAGPSVLERFGDGRNLGARRQAVPLCVEEQEQGAGGLRGAAPPFVPAQPTSVAEAAGPSVCPPPLGFEPSTGGSSGSGSRSGGSLALLRDGRRLRSQQAAQSSEPPAQETLAPPGSLRPSPESCVSPPFREGASQATVPESLPTGQHIDRQAAHNGRWTTPPPWEQGSQLSMPDGVLNGQHTDRQAAHSGRWTTRPPWEQGSQLSTPDGVLNGQHPAHPSTAGSGSESKEVAATAVAEHPKLSNGSRKASSSAKAESQAGQLPAAPTSSRGGLVQATKSFKAEDKCYLELEIGDLLVLTHPEVDGKFAGKNVETGQTGWFPVDAVKIAPPDAASKRRAGKAPAVAAEPHPPEAAELKAAEPHPPEAAELEASTSQPQDHSQEELGWAKFMDPATKKIWYWNSRTEEAFFAEEQLRNGWQQYQSDPNSHNSRLWWWHEATGRFFFDPLSS